MKSQALTIAEYLDELPEDRRAALETLLAMIRKAAPGAEESIQYGMPTFAKGGHLFGLASQKGYMALYVNETDAVETHRARLGKLDCGKGCIRFRKLENLPLDVVADILREASTRRGANQPVSYATTAGIGRRPSTPS